MVKTRHQTYSATAQHTAGQKRGSQSAADEPTAKRHIENATTCATSACSVHPPQDKMQLVLQLDKINAPDQRIEMLPGHSPYPQLLANWRSHEEDSTQYGIRLVGVAQQPDKWVGLLQTTLHLRVTGLQSA